MSSRAEACVGHGDGDGTPLLIAGESGAVMLTLEKSEANGDPATVKGIFLPSRPVTVGVALTDTPGWPERIPGGSRPTPQERMKTPGRRRWDFTWADKRTFLAEYWMPDDADIPNGESPELRAAERARRAFAHRLACSAGWPLPDPGEAS